jgi:hypothetical protein
MCKISFCQLFQFFLNYFCFILSRIWHIGRRKSKPKMALNKKSKLELNTWFEAKEFHPYPSKNDVTILALKTNSSEKQVKKWIENKRTRLKINTINENESNITANDKTILRKYYETQTNHPGPEELLLLENAIGKDKTKIRQWFNMQRFKDKASKN